ncbi:unnamed protein product [Fraxinus pennsylvanica]|uniref:Uncharacterized protein n=1 Tax=Fraxinus pennsylvanica TaxID=56036 RepID=A0AAD2A3A3_9LAMI|nr:unnamed protein product [Fraxinus pennsylvanica]
MSRLHKDNSSIADYMREVRQIVDTLSILDKELDPDEVTVHVLNGLDKDYKDIAATINAREPSLTIDELQEKLEAIEFQIKANQTPHQLSSPATANYTANKSSMSRSGSLGNRWSDLHFSFSLKNQHHLLKESSRDVLFSPTT